MIGNVTYGKSGVSLIFQEDNWQIRDSSKPTCCCSTFAPVRDENEWVHVYDMYMYV